MPDPYFSIIIPVLNGEKTIDACLNSIRYQDFADYEILVIDSLSTDKTVEKLNQYIKTDHRVKLHSMKLGIYEAMNYGINVSKGQFLYFMGCDDVLFNNFVLSDIVSVIKNLTDAHIVYGNVLMGERSRLYDGIFNLSKLYHWNICHQSIFYSRAVFDTVGFYDTTYTVHADWHFNFRCFAARKLNIVYVNHLICRYATNGFSSKNVDSLDGNKKEVFMQIARNADRKEYLRLKMDTVGTGWFAKTKYFFYVLCFGCVLLFTKTMNSHI